MHAAYAHLRKRALGVQEALGLVIQDVQKQLERETQRLEQAAYGEVFDPELAPVQEAVVGALQGVLQELDRADHSLSQAEAGLEDIPLA